MPKFYYSNQELIRSSIVSQGKRRKRVTHIVKHSPYNSPAEIGYTSGYSVSLAVPE